MLQMKPKKESKWIYNAYLFKDLKTQPQKNNWKYKGIKDLFLTMKLRTYSWLWSTGTDLIWGKTW